MFAVGAAALAFGAKGLYGVFDRPATLGLLEQWKLHITMDQHASASGLRKYKAARLQYVEEATPRFSVLDDRYNLFLFARPTEATSSLTAVLWNSDVEVKRDQFAKLQRWHAALGPTVTLTAEHLADPADYAVWCSSLDDGGEEEGGCKGVVRRV